MTTFAMVGDAFEPVSFAERIMAELACDGNSAGLEHVLIAWRAGVPGWPWACSYLSAEYVADIGGDAITRGAADLEAELDRLIAERAARRGSTRVDVSA